MTRLSLDEIEREGAPEHYAPSRSAVNGARRPTKAADWPAPLNAAAFHGLAGEVVRTLEPHTEADPAAVLLQFLSAFGNASGRHSYMQVEGDRHPPQIWPVLVGETSKARKGTSWGRIRSLFEEASPIWARERIASGLSSGEGVIWQVRDPIRSMQKDKKTGAYTEEETDAGVADKRLFVIEPEFASPLRHMERSGNTLSATLRSLWDSGNVSSLTKNSPARTTGAMVSVVGHVTIDELRRYLTRTEMGNGFANRLLFVCVRRSKELPFGGDGVDLRYLVNALKALLARLYGDRCIGWSTQAANIWRDVYHDLSVGLPGLAGAVVSRAEAQVIRLALIYALLDNEDNIKAEHLSAALSVWSYCRQSVDTIFDNTLGDPLADEINTMIRASNEGLTRTNLYDMLGRHKSRDQIGEALSILLKAGIVRMKSRPTGGRPEERWIAV